MNPTLHPDLPEDVAQAMRDKLLDHLRGLSLVVGCHTTDGADRKPLDPFTVIHLLHKRIALMEHEVRQAGLMQMNNKNTDANTP